MKFTKYQEMGDYHWRLINVSEVYKSHVLRLKNWVKETKILDVGAGDGLITFLLGAKGIDNEPSGVKIAQEKGVDVIKGSAYKIPFGDKEFEAVTMFDVLEHLKKPKTALAEALRVADYLYITTPLKSEKLADRFHYQEWTQAELKQLVEFCGYRQLESEVDYKVNTIYAKYQCLN